MGSWPGTWVPQNGQCCPGVLLSTNHFCSHSALAHGTSRSTVLISASSHSPAVGRSAGACKPVMNARSTRGARYGPSTVYGTLSVSDHFRLSSL